MTFELDGIPLGVSKYHEDTQKYLDGVDSDLVVLHNRCMANNLDSIIDFNTTGIPYIRSQTHIDLHNVFGKPTVQIQSSNLLIGLLGSMRYQRQYYQMIPRVQEE